MYVRLNQVVLGSYISTYLYCLLVLNTIKDGESYLFVPSISILIAIIAAVVNIILLIVFIHNIAMSIQADHVISDISNFISKEVDTLFPEKVGEEKSQDKKIDESDEKSGYQECFPVKSPASGYFQYIPGESVLKIISDKDALIEFYHRPGTFLVKDEEIGSVYSNEEWDEKDLEEISDLLVIGKTKTSQQDLEFSIHQMVEIAVRALSPGVNDPYTAIACIDNLTATLCHLAQAKFPSKYRFDEEDNLRIIIDTLDFEGVLNASFNQIRQFSGGSTAVIIRLMEALTTIHKFTNLESYKKAALKHAKMVLNTGKQTIEEGHDLNDLTQRAEKILEL